MQYHLPSDLSLWAGILADDFDIFEQRHGDPVGYNFRLAVAELVGNYITHANKGNPQKRVYLDILEYKQTVWAIVRGEGPKGKLEPAQFLQASGRGNWITSSKVDYMAYSEHGRAVYIGMRKQPRETAESPAA